MHWGSYLRRKDRSKILALENAWNQAEEHKDVKALEMLLHPNLVYIDYDRSMMTKEDCRKLCRYRVRLRALYLALGLKPIVQIVTLGPSALLVKFVGALPNPLVNRDQDGRLIQLRCC
jgi:hypothetical protein